MSFSIFHIKIRFLCVFVPLWLILNESNYGYNIGRASQLEYEPDPVGEYESGKAGALAVACPPASVGIFDKETGRHYYIL